MGGAGWSVGVAFVIDYADTTTCLIQFSFGEFGRVVIFKWALWHQSASYANFVDVSCKNSINRQDMQEPVTLRVGGVQVTTEPQIVGGIVSGKFRKILVEVRLIVVATLLGS
jgi:hypothetical protein